MWVQLEQRRRGFDKRHTPGQHPLSIKMGRMENMTREEVD